MMRNRERILILGLGRFGGGRAAAEFLARRGAALRIADAAAPETLTDSVRSLEATDAVIDWRLGTPHDETLLDGVDRCVLNPAIRPHHPLVDAATRRGIPITQEANVFLESFPGRVVLVTGTNGKSTTATLLAATLRRAGRDALLGGNLGRSLLDAEPVWHRDQIAVLEISSAQASRIDPDRHAVQGTVATRITRDHVDWHGSLDAYHAAKANALLAARQFVVTAADDPVARAVPVRVTNEIRYSAGEIGDVGVDSEWIVSRVGADRGRVLHPRATRLVGDFHVENFGAAFAASQQLGAPRHQAALALCRVEPLRHRLQLLAEHDGVRIFGNAVSTEVQSTVSALRSVAGPIRWVGGGKSKDGDFGSVADAVAPWIASAHLFGDAAPALGPRLASRVPTTEHTTLELALDTALAMARPGDAIVFSPAFASFDQFSNFRERAAAFESWLTRIQTASSNEVTIGTGPRADER